MQLCNPPIPSPHPLSYPDSDKQSSYQYTDDLTRLNSCRPPWEAKTNPTLQSIHTPLVVSAWDTALASHPDKTYAQYIVKGLQEGFRIGFRYGSPLRSATANMPSATQQPEVINDYLSKELARNRFIGPFEIDEVPAGIHISRFGVIPKGHNTGKWRLITDLSFPHGLSVNDGIDPALCSLTYTSVEKVSLIISEVGGTPLLAKIDIESAYRLVPVHPSDRRLLGVQWCGRTYVDPILPFGLRSAPKVFNAVADALQWYLKQSGIPHIEHYLDDFIIIAPNDVALCQGYVDTLNRVCSKLGVPIAEHKRDGPTTCLTFLGIEIDTVQGQLRLPLDKLRHLLTTVQSWQCRRTCTRKELESLIGLLNHACKVVRSGRSFLRRMLDLLHAVHRPPNSTIPIRLNLSFRSDLAWWLTFLPTWNGISYLFPPNKLPQCHLTTDASGSWGCGAWHLSSWFQLQWSLESQDLTIAEKELIPIILACAAWGQRWGRTQVICHCDNQVVVTALQSRTSKAKGIMHMIRCLAFIEARLECSLRAMYVSTQDNDLADDLSRNNLSSFLSKMPTADRYPTAISQPLLNLLLDHQADWMSPTWTAQFRSIFNWD